MKPLSARDVAEELGRSTEWLYANWRKLKDDENLPAPISGGGRGSELKWSAVQFYMWMDKDLPKALRDSCAAYRAAIEAARLTPATSASALVDEWEAKLEEKFGA